jgi:hypothetical protein
MRGEAEQTGMGFEYDGVIDRAAGALEVLLLGFCFLREAPERAVGSDRRAGKWGSFMFRAD